jgi:hypothetical protein
VCLFVRLEERIITVNIPLCLRCISRSRSARKDPRRVPLTFALRPWQSRETLRIDPISSLADRKSRKRSTSRAASRPATRRFVSFQSSLATTSLLVAFVLRAGKGELTLIYKRSLFSLKRALLYFYTSFLRLSLSIYVCILQANKTTHDQSTCGVKKKHTQHKFFYFFSSFVLCSFRARERQKTSQLTRRPRKPPRNDEEKEKEGHESKITFFFTDAPNSRFPSLPSSKDLHLRAVISK